MIIAITGATGLVGSVLVKKLINEGYTVHALVREPRKLPFLHKRLQAFHWDASQPPPAEALINAQALIHLAGENIAGGRWTAQRKKKLQNSRIQSCQNILETIKTISPAHRPKKFFTASAIGFYGSSLEQTFTETSPPGSDFLADLCQKWEKCALAGAELGMSITVMRFGHVLSSQGGLLQKIGPFIFAGGEHWISWVHIDDLVGFIIQSVDNPSFQGIYNICSHNPIKQKEMARLIVKNSKYPITIPVPAWSLRIALGELFDPITSSQKVLPNNLDQIGFNFKYDRLEQALSDLFQAKK